MGPGGRRRGNDKEDGVVERDHPSTGDYFFAEMHHRYLYPRMSRSPSTIAIDPYTSSGNLFRTSTSTFVGSAFTTTVSPARLVTYSRPPAWTSDAHVEPISRSCFHRSLPVFNSKHEASPGSLTR